MLPLTASHFLYRIGIGHWGKELRLARIYARTSTKAPGSWVEFDGYHIQINDPLNFYVLCKDLFINELYRFQTDHDEPRILDCGGNIGMSVLYFKHIYPAARIVTFEPDPGIYPFLEENMKRNSVKSVEVVRAAVSGQEGTLGFYSDGFYGSCLAQPGTTTPDGWKRLEVPCVRLSTYLDEPVDMLKVNIEGAECDVICECAARLRAVREMIIEYHHLPGFERNLHRILTVLHDQGFEYLVNDFDAETNSGTSAPFMLTAESRYLLLIYARRVD